MCALLGLLSIKGLNLKKVFSLKRTYFLIIFTTLWLVKNIIISGCVLYPVKSLCMQTFIWTDIKKVENISEENEAWTKGWPDYVNQQNKNNNDIISKKEFLKNFNWLPYWYNNHFNKVLEILIPYILFLIALTFFLYFKKNHYKKDVINKINIFFIIILFFSSLLWFIKVPVFRYGYSYFISLICFTFALFCVRLNYKKDLRPFFNYFLIFLITIFLTKNTIRVINSENDYNNYPWPKIYSMDENNTLAEFNESLVGNKIIITPKNGYCMYSHKICSHYSLNNNLSITNIKNFEIIYLNERLD